MTPVIISHEKFYHKITVQKQRKTIFRNEGEIRESLSLRIASLVKRY